MSMATHEARDVARDFFARCTAGDVSGAVDLIDGSATWWLLGRPDSPPVWGLYTKDRITDAVMRTSGSKICEVREYNDTHNAFAVWLQP